RKERVVAVDFGEQRLLRRDREHLCRWDAKKLRRGFYLSADLGIDVGLALKIIPQAVDLVQDDDAAGARGGIFTCEVAVPDFEVGLGHSGISGEDEEH